MTAVTNDETSIPADTADAAHDAIAAQVFGAGMTVPPPDESWTPAIPDRRTLRAEMWLVLWVSIAATALKATLSLIDTLTSGAPISSHSTTLVGTFIADRQWLDALYQASFILLPLVPVLLVVHLLRRSGDGRQSIGLDMRDWPWDLLKGAVLAFVLGLTGLVFYLIAFKLGMNVRIAAVTADRHWWTPILLVASASYNAILEEVIVLAYFIHRAAQIGWKPWQQVGGSALLRGAYHLYQGFGGFLGNLAMGTVFALLYRRWGRVMPFLWAHLFIDAVAFLGYYYLGGHVSWLP
jgi:membrane protease YdiL (CAAX protease family)